MILRARVVLPMTGPPISDGAVLLDDRQIKAVGRWSALRSHGGGPVIDLGERVLLPGLINAHCHLDYTRMAGLLPPPRHFTTWIQSIMTLKASWGYTEFAHSWLEGARMLVQSGTTTVVDVEAVPELLPEAWTSTPMRVLSMRELIHLRDRPEAAHVVERALADWDLLPAATGRVGLSPHSPYAASTTVLTRSAQVARERGWLLTTHLAESEEEFQMFTTKRGRLFEWLKDQRDMTDCGRGSPVQHLEACGYLGPKLLAVHVNYLGANDAPVLARHGVSVVHCPRSHTYFGHQPFPVQELAAAAINICLGTDSLATIGGVPRNKPSLSLFAEMAALAKAHPGLRAERIVEMTTIRAAQALGRAADLGGLFPGGLADLIALPYAGSLGEVFEGIVHHTGPVDCSMIDGRWALELGCTERT